MTINISEIIKSYAQGYFLMAGDNGELNWYSSRKRTIMPLDDRFRYPKSLNRQLNQNRFEVKINHHFEGVCHGCADRETTWISEELIEIYLILHHHGWAHSFETWQGDQLAGGLMGIVIGGAFIGESMFYAIPEGSKVAMVKLVQHLRARKFTLFDVQIQNPHLERFGAYEIDNHTYNQILINAVKQPCRFV